MLTRREYKTDNMDHRHPAIRAIHVLPSLGAGGADRVALSLVRDLRALGIQAWLVNLGSREKVLPKSFGKIEITDCRFQVSRPSHKRNATSFFRLLHKAVWLRQQIVTHQVNVVHSHLWPAARMASVACIGLPILHVIHCHGQEPWLKESPRRRAFARLLFRNRFTVYIAVAEAVREYVSSSLTWVRRDRFRIVYNGVDIEEFANLDYGEHIANDQKPEFVIGSAGRFIPRKGHEYLFRALAHLRERGIKARAIVVGNGPLRNSYERLCSELGISDCVSMPGVMEDMGRFYATLDAFVFPSTHDEGLPLAVLEAMACRVPVIGTDVAGIRELIRDGVDGFVIPPCDVEGIVRKLEQLWTDKELRKNVAQSGQTRVLTQFTSRAVAERVYDIYRQELVSCGFTVG